MSALAAKDKLDALREILQIGAARASDALRELIDCPTSIRLTQVEAAPVDRAIDLLQPLDTIRIVTYVPISGTMGGHFFITMSAPAVGRFERLAGVVDESREYRRSFFEEVANVVANHYLRAIAPFVGRVGQQDIPSYVEGLPESIFDGILSELGLEGGTALVGRTECEVSGELLDIEFIWFFNAGELDALWKMVEDIERGKR